MTPPRTRPLRLEAVEDRCLLSSFPGVPHPSAHDSRHAEFRLDREVAAPFRPLGDRVEETTVVWVPMIRVSVPAVTGDLPTLPDPLPEPQPVAEQPESPEADPSATASKAGSVSVAVPGGDASTVVSANSPSGIAGRPALSAPSAPDAPRTASADAPAAGVVFYGVAVPAETELPRVVTTPVPPAEVPTPGELPSPREVVEQVFDALLPAGVPLAGVVPFDAEALDAAAELIAKLPGLAPTAEPDGWGSPERWAWVTAGVLVVGGAAYAARGASDRRALAPALGVDSALARREDRRRDRKPA